MPVSKVSAGASRARARSCARRSRSGGRGRGGRHVGDLRFARSCRRRAGAARRAARRWCARLDVLALGRRRRCRSRRRGRALEHGADRGAVVADVQPVAHVLAVAVDRQRLAGERVDDHQRDQLFGELVRAVVVGAVGGEHRQAVGVVEGAHQVVGRRLAGANTAVRRVGRGLGERRRCRPASRRPRRWRRAGSGTRALAPVERLPVRARASSSAKVPTTLV
jgi:hypothetical protein